VDVRRIFRGVDLIIHVGDLDTPAILEELRRIAPVTAVRGNMDRGTWAYKLRASETVVMEKVVLYIIHDEGKMDLEPDPVVIHAVIFGHTHSACIDCTGAVMRINPGSATQPRGGVASVVLLQVDDGKLDAEIVPLARVNG